MRVYYVRPWIARQNEPVDRHQQCARYSRCSEVVHKAFVPPLVEQKRIVVAFYHKNEQHCQRTLRPTCGERQGSDECHFVDIGPLHVRLKEHDAWMGVGGHGC